MARSAVPCLAKLTSMQTRSTPSISSSLIMSRSMPDGKAASNNATAFRDALPLCSPTTYLHQRATTALLVEFLRSAASSSIGPLRQTTLSLLHRASTSMPPPRTCTVHRHESRHFCSDRDPARHYDKHNFSKTARLTTDADLWGSSLMI